MAQALGTIAHIILHGSKPPRSGRGEAAAAQSLIDDVNWYDIDHTKAGEIYAILQDGYGARTVNKHVAALRGTLKQAISIVREAGRKMRANTDMETSMRLAIQSQDRQDALADAIAVLKTLRPPESEGSEAAGRALKLGELMALVASCQDGTPSGARDAAILAVAYSCGLRRAEIVGIDLADFNRTDSVFKIRGKGNKVRHVPIQNGARQAVNDWLAIRGEDAGPLFWHVRKGGAIINRRMTTQAVYYIFTERAKAAGVDNFSPHDMRRTFAGDLLDAGADIATVQKMMGHANVSTTAGYDRRGERAKQDAAKRLHFPYQHKSQNEKLP